MHDSIPEDVVGEDDLCTIYKGRAVGKDGDRQLLALKGLDGGVAEPGREDDIVGHEVVLQDLLDGSLVGLLEDGADALKRGVVGYEDGEVGNVEQSRVVAGQAKVDVQVGSAQGAVEVGVAGAVGEELERGAESDDLVNLVDDDALAEFDVLHDEGQYFCFEK